jgi:hypothetical protein
MSWTFTDTCPSCKNEHIFCKADDEMPSTSIPHEFICPVTGERTILPPDLPPATRSESCPLDGIPITEKSS